MLVPILPTTPFLLLAAAFTMNTYSHIIDGMQSDAMALLDEVMPSGIVVQENNINAKLTPTLLKTTTNN